MPRTIHPERHFTERIGWLRAAVLGANDGIVSTAALVVGVAAAGTERSALLVAGLAGLVAGAMSARPARVVRGAGAVRRVSPSGAPWRSP